MLGKLVQRLLLAGAMCGLCASASANTTAEAAQHSVAVPLAPVAPAAPRVKIALLLPTQSETFGAAARAVRAGFLSAHEREADGIALTVLETADGPQHVLQVYVEALAEHDIVVGPLARADVAAVAQSGRVDKPTLVLANPDSAPDAAIALPPKMLPIGLSVEDEARQVAGWAGAGRRSGKALVVSTNIAWQRRTANAFAAAWQRLGLEAQQVELAGSGGYLHAAGLEQLKKRLQDEPPSHIFYALDALQAGQMQVALGRVKANIYGTSQVNLHAAAAWLAAERRPDMNGVHLVDMPWLLQSDHPAVMVYPRLVVAADQSANPDRERLYALGIDAFRIAREIAAQRTEFELDGVTGQLKVNLGSAAQRFSRTMQRGWYQDGMAVPFPRNP